ncbi:MAG: macro domain-containing protein [Proteobacteria bacterium]|nr:macro domain-containing protein [Pseudomonadota bacterium]
MPVDAIVNPANSLGIMGGGIGGTLRRQGGDVIQQAAMAAAPIAVGAAIVTTAGQLPAKNVIHVPTMEEPGQKIGAENVRRAARAALIASDRNGFKVIAIPGIGTDLGEVPIDEAARAIVEEIRAHRLLICVPASIDRRKPADIVAPLCNSKRTSRLASASR